nr:unnamed protein product [Callosobruchus chinensis]
MLLKLNNIGILAISEHHLADDYIEYIKFVDFRIVTHFSRTIRKNGGAAILAKSNIECTPINLQNISVEGHVELCATKFILDNSVICIVAVYRPPNGCIYTFIDNLSRALAAVSATSRNIVLCGDFNINVNKTCPDTLLLMDVLESFNIFITTTEPTRIFVNAQGHMSSSAIDYMATNLPQNNVECKIVNPNIADHFAHILSVKCTKSSEKKNAIKYLKRDLRPENIDRFKYLVLNHYWRDLHTMGVHDSFKYFIETLRWCLDYSCPVRTITRFPSSDNNSNFRKGWVNDNIIRQGTYLRDLFHLMKNINSERIRNLYHLEKKSYKKNIVLAKSSYFMNRIMNSENKVRETWNIVNRKLGKPKVQEKISIQVNDLIISERKEISNKFAESFVSSVPDAVNKIFSYNLSLQCTTCSMRNETIFITPAINGSVRDVLREMKKNSAGFDGLTLRILSEVEENIIPVLVHLINKSIEYGIFPDILKLAIVIPVHKKGNPNLLENYRQISLLSVVSKIFEKFMHKQISSFAIKYGILSPQQHGFQANKSIETASCSYLEYIYTQLDRGKYVNSLLFDLSKAFDSISKEHLKEKIYGYGNKGHYL